MTKIHLNWQVWYTTVRSSDNLEAGA